MAPLPFNDLAENNWMPNLGYLEYRFLFLRVDLNLLSLPPPPLDHPLRVPVLFSITSAGMRPPASPRSSSRNPHCASHCAPPF